MLKAWQKDYDLMFKIFRGRITPRTVLGPCVFKKPDSISEIWRVNPLKALPFWIARLKMFRSSLVLLCCLDKAILSRMHQTNKA